MPITAQHNHRVASLRVVIGFTGMRSFAEMRIWGATPGPQTTQAYGRGNVPAGVKEECRTLKRGYETEQG